MAAKKANVHADPTCIGYEFACDEVLDEVNETLRVETLRMLTRSEVLHKLETTFQRFPPDVKVVFANQRCQSCGQVCQLTCYCLIKNLLDVPDRRSKTHGG